MSSRLESQLNDVVRLCRLAETLASRGREWFDSDPEAHAPRLAADSVVLKLGEAVRRLPEEFLSERADDPTWRRAIGMRNRIAHDMTPSTTKSSGLSSRYMPPNSERVSRRTRFDPLTSVSIS